jgi:hypothetical protein
MAGGGSRQPDYNFVQSQAQFEPLPESDIQANMGPAFGPTATPNPYVVDNAPAWATGHFAMPWWGRDPFGAPLTQEQMMYQQPEAPAAPAAPTPQVQLPQPDPAAEYERWRRGQQIQRMRGVGWLDDDVTRGREPDLSYGNYLMSMRR